VWHSTTCNFSMSCININLHWFWYVILLKESFLNCQSCNCMGPIYHSLPLLVQIASQNTYYILRQSDFIISNYAVYIFSVPEKITSYNGKTWERVSTSDQSNCQKKERRSLQFRPWIYLHQTENNVNIVII